MLVKIVNPPLGSSNGFNTDHEQSGVGLDVAIVKRSQGADRYWVLDGIQYSYANSAGPGTLAAPILGGLTVFDGDKVVWDADIMDQTGSLSLYIVASPDNELKVLLKSGGDKVIGKLNIQTHLEGA